MGKALYRKYRSKKLSEVVGQEHITETLTKALDQNKISHAYLFTGPRGVGKTSVARILAHEINKLPYQDDTTHIDIIEIDAASNRRIDEIRELRDKVYIAPAEAAYKVYIIDEVHMLTREAFNALLKTLEEPPSHVVFILATTDAHKLPETIISRTQRFTFRPVAINKVTEHLRTIAEREKISIDDVALGLIAAHGEGSFRDSISLLDQSSGMNKQVTATDVENLLGLPNERALQELYEIMLSGSSAELMQKLQSLADQGYHAALIAKEFGNLIRKQLGEKSAGDTSAHLISLLMGLLEVASSPRPDKLLELQLLQTNMHLGQSNGTSPITSATMDTKTSASTEQLDETPPKPDPSEHSQKKTHHVTKPTKQVEPRPEIATVKPQLPDGDTQSFDMQAWGAILELLKKRHNTLYGVIRMAEPKLTEAHTLQLQFSFAFHQKRINEPTNRQLLIGIIKEVTGTTYTVECVHNKQARPPKLSNIRASEKPKKELDTISNIFGGGELLES